MDALQYCRRKIFIKKYKIILGMLHILPYKKYNTCIKSSIFHKIKHNFSSTVSMNKKYSSNSYILPPYTEIQILVSDKWSEILQGLKLWLPKKIPNFSLLIKETSRKPLENSKKRNKIRSSIESLEILKDNGLKIYNSNSKEYLTQHFYLNSTTKILSMKKK